jgi:hypothetical protein
MYYNYSYRITIFLFVYITFISNTNNAQSEINNFYSIEKRRDFVQYLVTIAETEAAIQEYKDIINLTDYPLKDTVIYELVNLLLKTDRIPAAIEAAAAFSSDFEPGESKVTLAKQYNDFQKQHYQAAPAAGRWAEYHHLLNSANAFVVNRKMPVIPADINNFELRLAYVRMQKIPLPKRKSPMVAGLLSILPGGGKFYLQKIGSAVNTILVCGGFAAQAWEGYWRYGKKSIGFYVYSGLLTLFYTGSIYGSIQGARKYNFRMETDFRQQVQLAVEIPIRRVLR